MKRTYKIVFVMLVSCALLFISACGQAENNEEETSAESGYEKIVLIDKSISLCEAMDPADSFEVSEFLKKDEKVLSASITTREDILRIS